MVDLGQTGGSNSACLFFIPCGIKKPIAFTIGSLKKRSAFLLFFRRV
jgi:hypothetical protein